MKTTIFLLFVVLLAAQVFAQTDAHKSFDAMKTFAGTWQGKVTTMPAQAAMKDTNVSVSLRVTSMGNAMIHEMKTEGQPDDPITMFYLDQDQLLLTHYCDAGNRPRMIGKMSPDGKKVEFEFVDITGNLQYGHMDHAVFTAIDENHHTEDWTFKLQGDKTVQAHFDLQRAK